MMTQLETFKRRHEFFIGVDSDGCVFDTMETKHKKVFIPLAVEIWGMKEIEKQFTETAEFVNLYSCLRGMNRFPALLKTFRLMENRKDMKPFLHRLPPFHQLEDFCTFAKSYSNQELCGYMTAHKGTFLEELLFWSEEGDRRMKTETEGNQPFPFAKPALERMAQFCDTMIVSAAASSALEHEWGQCGLLDYMSLCAGQEWGSKKKQLSVVGKNGYQEGRALMIGDSPGDLEAAKENKMLFYPIIPRWEEKSWSYFGESVLDAFLEGRYEGEWEKKMISRFMEEQPRFAAWETLNGEVSII
ncbi:haloacid dehalogenase [Clostridium sp. chh4-2]|uniref:HAD family hydrolase n=1 Tax=Clostridium sp. chh4-2 TaxID=2067550 RepID=UPI000CCE6529|nr:HAD hydrolase-like protein [Clostridium sp. chh4-2]PNV60945.1 haloacid dehalogenase [Clostridium sp. chh4-2]